MKSGPISVEREQRLVWCYVIRDGEKETTVHDVDSLMEALQEAFTRKT